MSVRAWKENIKIATYGVGEPDRNPMFLENRVYQGSSGVIYPHPVIDKVYDEKEEKEWIGLFLENEYLKIMVMPELGGRIRMAFDKTNDYHFVYYNEVIKPALVGLAGPWISGGIEFNWPQHHRPSTFSPLDYTITENSDGSQTIWVNEYEKMFGTKCAMGFTLHPGKAYIELSARIYNCTGFPQSFLWWANIAVAADEHYQSIFPPDVHAVFDHGKKDVSDFPIATGTYYKVNYAPGTDISRYSNIPVPTSYMAVNSNFDFLGGYHHKKEAGIIHVANRHISPGKKQWTWGNGDFGKSWDRQLTDENGPYVELMCGVYTDNQPDFSWLMPHESRSFSQYFMPFKKIGGIKNATKDVAVNLEVIENKLCAGVYASAEMKVRILLTQGKQVILDTVEQLSPVKVFLHKIDIQSTQANSATLQLSVYDDKENLLITYTPVKNEDTTLPDPASEIPHPLKITSNEELYLAGLHLEQYRHASFSPVDYYEEALKRDEGDARNNNALGLWYLRRGKFALSETYFRRAIKRLQQHNSNIYDGEPLFNLGLALQYQCKYQEAYDNFYKATWNGFWRDNAFYQLACISAKEKKWNEAIAFCEQSLQRNSSSIKTRHLKTCLLRYTGKPEEALNMALASLQQDAFDFGSLFETYFLYDALAQPAAAADALSRLQQLTNNDPDTFIAISIDYEHAGFTATAIALLMIVAENSSNPMIHYYLGYYESQAKNKEHSALHFEKGFTLSPERVFTNRLEDINVLNAAIAYNAGDYKAFYYLGNLYYDKRQYDDARDCWEKSIKACSNFATTHRNLGLAYYNKFNKKAAALACYEKAFYCNPSDARVLFELDQLKKKMLFTSQERLAFLQRYENLLTERDDLYLEFISLLGLVNQTEQAYLLLMKRKFHPWEGGEGRVTGQYVRLLVALAKTAYKNDEYETAIELLESACVYPASLGEGKLPGARENDVFYWMGCCYHRMGNTRQAEYCWEKAAGGVAEPTQAIFYNDQQPDKIFYQALALKKLGRRDESGARFTALAEYGKAHLNDVVRMDFFAVSFPDLMIFNDDLTLRNRVHCHFMLGLGLLGLGADEEAAEQFRKVLELEPAHAGAQIHSGFSEHFKSNEALTETGAAAFINSTNNLNDSL
ncbi:MAG: DUF5107 domain-containing protein [Bacteroidota bacterium]